MEPQQEPFVERLRAKWLAALPPWYLPFGHLAGTTGICAVAIAGASWRLHWPGLIGFAVILGNLVVANFFEWFVHKHLMHRKHWPVRVLYEKHTVMHHKLYREDSMALKDWRELAFVLVPSAGILGAVLASMAMCSLFALVLGSDVGLLSVVTQASYVLAYELSHLSYHLPVRHPIRRLPLLRKLSRHHARHHDPKLMQRHNFNVTVPLADWVLGTMAPKRDGK